jgi:hypothetical protein
VPLGHLTKTVAVVALLAAAPAQAAPRHVELVFVEHTTLSELAALPGASVGLVSATDGRYRREQALLDISQGARAPLSAYDPDEPPPVRVTRTRVLGWDAVVRRAAAAPADLVPGLLASTVPARFAGSPRGEAVVAADRAGRLRVSEGSLTVRVVSHTGEVPRAQAGTLLLVVRDPPGRTVRSQLLPMAAIGLGSEHSLTSISTRTDGLVTGTDLFPTIARWLGRTVPKEVQGQPLRLDGPADVGALRDLEARLRVVPGRRLPTLGALALAWLALLALARGRPWAWRAGALSLLWVLPVLLVTAAFAPSRTAEALAVALGALALGAGTDRLVAWPRAPLVPAGIAVAAYLADLAFGSPLIVRSLFGPNPLFGARFYGIGNELEATLPVLALTATAAALGARGRSRSAAVAFAGTGAVLAAGIGAARLGADAGGVITVGAGTAIAAALAAPGRLTARRVVLVVVAPAAAVVALALLDLATGGNGHFTRTILRADDTAALGDVILRRYELAFHVLLRPAMLVLTPLCLLAIALAIRERRALLRGIPGAPMWGAALAGSAACGIAGALFNDSGPLLLVFSTVLAASVLLYLRAGAGRTPVRGGRSVR